MIYLVLFCYCFRVIPILIMKNSFKVNTIIYVYWYIYIYTEKINFLHLYAHILWISHLIAYFAKFYIWSQTPKKKNHCKQLYWIKTKWVFLCAQIA